MSKAMLIDVTRCVGCLACEAGCSMANELPEDTETRALSDKKWTYVKTVKVEEEEKYVRRMCMHCEHPSCASVCPVKAFHKTEEGPVIYDQDRCMGCRYCMMACPFSVPAYEWHEARRPRVRKCIMCYGRITQGEMPGCAEMCPTEATKFGEREELLKEAHQRIADDPDTYFPVVFGEKEAGGTSVLFLADTNFATLGFPTGLGTTPLPERTETVLHKLPGVAVTVGASLVGLWWVINRRDTLAQLPEDQR